MFRAISISETAPSTGTHSTVYEVVDFHPDAPGYGLDTNFRGWVASYTWESGKPMSGVWAWNENAPMDVRETISKDWGLALPKAA